MIVKVILYLAISADGFIATLEGNSDWVSETDAQIFEEKAKKIGCIVVGRRTFEQFYQDIFPLEGVVNIVLSRRSSPKTKDHNVIFVSSPLKALSVAEKKGFEQILLVGGGHANAAFLQEGLIDEIFLSVHPLILGEGIKLFEDFEKLVKLKLLGSKKIADLVQLHYRIVKP